ncbi:MAG: hypothetical protein GEU73_07655 [Chloroflexi bacterium]|nr:hypothetical protein [Chloroflexota bacterium]
MATSADEKLLEAWGKRPTATWSYVTDPSLRDVLADARKTQLEAKAGQAAVSYEEAVKAVEAVEEQIDAASIEVDFRGLSNREWRKLIASHPPTPDDGEGADIHVESFAPDLIAECSDLDPETAQKLWDELPPGEADQLYMTAFRLHVGGRDPFDLAAVESLNDLLASLGNTNGR